MTYNTLNTTLTQPFAKYIVTFTGLRSGIVIVIVTVTFVQIP